MKKEKSPLFVQQKGQWTVNGEAIYWLYSTTRVLPLRLLELLSEVIKREHREKQKAIRQAMCEAKDIEL